MRIQLERSRLVKIINSNFQPLLLHLLQWFGFQVKLKFFNLNQVSCNTATSFVIVCTIQNSRHILYTTNFSTLHHFKAETKHNPKGPWYKFFSLVNSMVLFNGTFEY